MRRRGTIVLALSWGVLVRRRMKQWRLSTLSVPLLSLSDLCSRQGRARRRVSDAGRSEKKGAARNRSSRVRHYSHRLPVAGCIDNSSYAAEFSPSRHSTGIAKKKNLVKLQEIKKSSSTCQPLGDGLLAWSPATCFALRRCSMGKASHTMTSRCYFVGAALEIMALVPCDSPHLSPSSLRGARPSQPHPD